MPEFRPFSRELLKKMVLKTMYEHQDLETERTTGLSNFVFVISKYFIKDFDIAPLNDEELISTTEAVLELDIEGFIVEEKNGQRYITKKGKIYTEDRLLDLKLPSQEIEQYLTRQDLREFVLNDYLSGDYETTIYKAFRFLEERVMQMSFNPPKGIDPTLISKSYISAEGELKYSSIQTEEELRSLERMMRGTMLWFRDPANKSSVGVNNPDAAAQVLVFANLHLSIIDK